MGRISGIAPDFRIYRRATMRSLDRIADAGDEVVQVALVPLRPNRHVKSNRCIRRGCCAIQPGAERLAQTLDALDLHGLVPHGSCAILLRREALHLDLAPHMVTPCTVVPTHLSIASTPINPLHTTICPT